MSRKKTDDTVEALLDTIDHHLNLTRGRTLVSSTEVANHLLDIRNIAIQLRGD